MILTDREIKKALLNHDIEIDGIDYDDLYIGPASVDMHLDNKAKIMKTMLYPDSDYSINTRNKEEIESAFEDHNDWEELIIHPNEFYILSTKEKITLPKNIAGFVQGRSSIARMGIFVNVAGFVDPGFSGNITLEVINLTQVPIKLFDDMRICQIVFTKLSGESKVGYNEKKDAKYYKQSGPTTSRIAEDYEGEKN